MLLGVEMFERIGRGLVVELSDDGRRFARREIADDLGELGRMQPSELLSLTERRTCDGLASRIGETELQAIIERGTRDRSGREAPAERLQPEPAQQPGDANVRSDDAQPSAGVGHLDVVDAHDLAPVDVDDLLVEQIGDEIELLSLLGAGSFGAMVSATVPLRSTSATVSIGAKRRPCDVLMTRPSIGGNVSSGLLTRKSETFPMERSLTVARRPTSSEMNPSVNVIPVASHSHQLWHHAPSSRRTGTFRRLSRIRHRLVFGAVWLPAWRLSTFRGSGM